jgi:DNA-binding PadR family transcriptional regulator
MKGEALKGHLDMLLLAAVQVRPTHGYAVIEELRRLSGGAFDLPEGTVYPALHRLERGGLLASAWSTDAPRRRRVYELTQRGRGVLAAYERDWDRFSRGVAAVLSARPA